MSAFLSNSRKYPLAIMATAKPKRNARKPLFICIKPPVRLPPSTIGSRCKLQEKKPAVGKSQFFLIAMTC